MRKLKEIIEEGSHNGFEIQEGNLIVHVWHATSPEFEKEAARQLQQYMKLFLSRL